MLDLTNKIYLDKDSARKHLEGIRWPNGPFCPHCGEAENVKPLKGKSHRPGLHKCYSCKGNFSVTVGTVFERSKIPLNKWILASHLMASSKKGISAHQLHHQLGVTYKTAWFMEHRLREAMRVKISFGKINDPDKMGGDDSTVEVDETYIGRTTRRKSDKPKALYNNKEKVLTLVERGGHARSFHVSAVNAKTLRPIMLKQINQNTTIYTDDALHHRSNKKFFKKHDSVNHSAYEYVRAGVHTNTIENYFSILKRGLNGVYQHVSPEHLKRYLAEYDFRYNYRQKLGYDDMDRANMLLKGIEGKRLMYR